MGQKRIGFTHIPTDVEYESGKKVMTRISMDGPSMCADAETDPHDSSKSALAARPQ
jgi:hypothetical protein